MFAPLPSPELAYEMFKLRERELLREAEMSWLDSQRRVAWPSRRHRLRVRAGGLMLSLGARLKGEAVPDAPGRGRPASLQPGRPLTA